MVDALVTVAAEAILKKALSIAANEVSIALRYKEKLTELHDTLDVIRAKLSDAEGKEGTEAVMVWLKQLKSVVDEADDVLDEVRYERLRREVKKRYQGNKARKILCVPNLKKFSFGRDMGHKIENINDKLSRIYERANNLGLQDERFERAGNSYRPGTDPDLDEFKIVGREEDKLRIVELLTNSRGERLTIVPIVGMGGIGKTTLAKSVYNNPIIEQHFDKRAWLCVSVKVEVDTLLANIYESLAGEKVKSLTRVNVIKDLKEKLGSKRYLLVLDDVWDEELEYWDKFRRCMLKVNSANGSGIIITTRKLDIDRNAYIEDSYPLESLSYDDSWEMFKERALLLPALPAFVEIGSDIVKKCRGFPLLVDILGSMLRHYNTNIDKWLSIQKSGVWDADESCRVQSILKLSFDNLPNSMVKQCFLYCATYEKDEVIEREEVVQLWMALGLVQTDTTRNKEMEEVGNDIFKILVSNSLFQNVTKDQFGDIDSCQMHDLVHDLLLSLTSHEISRLVVSNDVQIPAVKHLALQQKYYENSVFDIFKEDMTSRTLQTLFFAGEVKENISFQYFKCLRILKLNSSSLEEVPESIGELVHLRYLDLSRTRIRTLPKSIGKLYHLQTLKLLYCSENFQFPQEMRNLISLRHLVYDSRVQAPKDVVLLTSLRTLPSFQVGRQKGRQIEELGHLKHLGLKAKMAEALLTAAVEGILNKVLSMAANEVAVALHYENKLTELHKTLKMIRAKLSDAEGKKSTHAVMEWMEQLKSVVDEADDVLDEVHYELLRREVKKRYQGNKDRKIPGFLNLKKFLFKREMGHKIENINTNFSQICEQATKLGLQNEQFEPAGNSYRPGTVPDLDGFKIVGREKDEQRIVELLTNSREGERLTIVPIVGMGGIGKTTLAKSVYNNPKIEQHFNVRAWLCVSIKVEVDTLLADIYESLAGEKVKSFTRVNVIKDLKEKLGSKRYLLVLDDVWDEELLDWDDFRKCMLCVKSVDGSGIIVTTRKLNIGTNATINKDSHPLGSLSYDDSWDMFKERAFKERALPLLPLIESIGRDIVRRCDGLPLLVDILGSMLRRYNTNDNTVTI